MKNKKHCLSPKAKLIVFTLILGISMVALARFWGRVETTAFAATFTATNTNDSGAGSLRQAILDSNANPDADTISFNIPANDPSHFYYSDDSTAGQVTLTNVMTTTASDDTTISNIDPDWPHSWWSIQPVSALPTATQQLTINGYTQPGASPNTQASGNDAVLRIELDGSASTVMNGLDISAGSSTVRGLVVNGFVRQSGGGGGSGIVLQTNGSNRVEGCFLGTDPSGTLAQGNGEYGVKIQSSSNNMIGGPNPAERNLISGNGNSGQGGGGVGITSTGVEPTGNLVQGNFIGTNAAGTAALGNSFAGVAIVQGANNTVGGTTVGARNIISGNQASGGIGVSIQVRAGTNNIVQGNFIGTDVTGTLAVGNSIGVSADVATSPFITTIGGMTPGARNIISGNLTSGVRLFGGRETLVQGNFIGTDMTGTLDLGNGEDGIFCMGLGNNNMIGGDAPGAGNLISGNDRHGVFIIGSFGNVVRGNLIGTNAAGTGALGNAQVGVATGGGGLDHVIGGTAAGQGNTIAFNGSTGVAIFTLQTTVLSNSIFSNGGLGIDLENNGVTPNDTGDTDSGANNLQNFPVLTSAFMGCGTTVSGTLNSTPSTTFTLQFFSNPSCDIGCHGEGKTFLGSGSLTTDAGGNASFNFAVAGSAVGGSFITATATDPAGNTSEFSQCILASSLSRARECFTSLATTGSVMLTVPASCGWTAMSNDPWVQITSATSGIGPATINFSIDANVANTRRVGTLTIAGETFTVLQGAQFVDVPTSHLFFNEIGKISALGITVGCGGGNYCPDRPVTREEMAAFIIRALGEFNPPTPTMQRFNDVPPSNVFYAFIDRMAVLQITLGCGGNNYCPIDPVLREQMAAFIIRGLGIFNPPEPAQQRFADVPPTNPFYAFIEAMAVRGITLGCGGGNYCPEQSVTRGQMAAFLIRAFGCGNPMCIAQ
jgi:BACON domain-containing protein/S-layer family protein